MIGCTGGFREPDLTVINEIIFGQILIMPGIKNCIK